MLLDAGANIEARKSRTGETALHKAIRAGKVEHVRMLVERGADTKAKDGTGGSRCNFAKIVTSKKILKAA